jgi:nicotinate-nucleotide--dimethylbenzimidazole phosphoribosyltransferase
MTSFSSIGAFGAALADLCEPNADAAADARVRQSELTKPAGSLGRLEELAVFFAGWHSHARPRIDRARAAIFAGNHGVTVHGVSAAFYKLQMSGAFSMPANTAAKPPSQ